ncbi:MAG: type VI secretion system baseplate subunit TssK, partial [Pseudomonadota bacterium]
TEILGLVRHRADAIANRIGDPSVRGTAEVGDYLMLQALNRTDPVLAHLAAQGAQIHPERVYTAFLSLAGELATFASDTKRATAFPDYRHDDPAATFQSVVSELRQQLSTVLDRSAVPIPLEERRHGVRVANIADRSLLDAPAFVLAIRADMAEEAIRRGVPPQIKIGSVDRIAELVNVALPGINVKPLPVVPRQLPYRRGTVYFELETGDKMWDQVAESATLAVHIAADLPGLEIELWAIRS